MEDFSLADKDTSLPSFPSTSGAKPSALHVYTVEECQNCKQRLKRDFKTGDYVMGIGNTCDKCHAQRVIVLIYGEETPPARGRQSRQSNF